MLGADIYILQNCQYGMNFNHSQRHNVFNWAQNTSRQLWVLKLLALIILDIAKQLTVCPLKVSNFIFKSWQRMALAKLQLNGL